MENGKVINLKFVRAKYEQTSCRHKCVTVNEDTRTVICDSCDIVVDAFDYLRHCCYQEQSAFDDLARYEIEVSKLQKRYNNLTKEIERLNKVKRAMS